MHPESGHRYVISLPCFLQIPQTLAGSRFASAQRRGGGGFSGSGSGSGGGSGGGGGCGSGSVISNSHLTRQAPCKLRSNLR